MSLHFCRNKDKRILLLPEERRAKRCRFCIQRIPAGATKPIITNPRQPAPQGPQPEPISQPLPALEIEHDIVKRSDALGMTRLDFRHIEFFWGGLCDESIVDWSNYFKMDLADLCVELMKDTEAHELIHAIGRVHHTPRLNQARFQKVTALMGHDIRLKMREKLGGRTYPTMDRICIDLDKDDNLNTTMANSDQSLYKQPTLFQGQMNTQPSSVRIGNMEIKVKPC